ncbi:MAG: hypothetical protein EOP78_00405, partial [Variovorax sp.]
PWRSPLRRLARGRRTPAADCRSAARPARCRHAGCRCPRAHRAPWPARKANRSARTRAGLRAPGPSGRKGWPGRSRWCHRPWRLPYRSAA